MGDPCFSLRLATPDDLPQILAIEHRSYASPWTQEAFSNEMKKPFSSFLVLTDDETDSIVIGYIVFWLMFDECHILNIALHPDWRGLGYAGNLLRYAINQAILKDCKRVFLEVRKSNAPAIMLYQKLHFFIDHVKKGFYEDGEDAYFMVLSLAPIHGQDHSAY